MMVILYYIYAHIHNSSNEKITTVNVYFIHSCKTLSRKEEEEKENVSARAGK